MPSPYDISPLGFPSFLDTPEMRRQQGWDALAGLAQGLIASSGPSPYPRDPLSVFGSAVGGALSGVNEDKYLKRAAVGAQVAKSQSDLANDKAWRDMFSGATMPSEAAAPPAAAPAAPAASSPAPNQAEFVQQMLPHALAVSQATGLDPRLVIAQSALETGFGKAAPGNNYFGIKGPGQELQTTEVGAGGLYPTKDSFRTYASPADSAQDYAKFVKGNSRYAPVLQAQGLDAQIDAMGKSGYATDPNYGTKLRQIAQTIALPGGPQVAQGGDTGNVVPVQAQAPAAPPQAAAAPVQTLPQVIQSLPPSVRQFIGAMPRKEGTAALLKYIDPEMTPAIDQNGQVVFAPKTMLGSGRYTPVDAQKLANDTSRLELERQRTAGEAANRKIIVGPDGKPVMNQPLIEADKSISAAQGTDVESKMRLGDYEEVRKTNSGMQGTALQAQTGLAQLNRLTGLLDGISTGKFKGTTTEIKAAAKSFGVDLGALGVTDDVGPVQAATALANQFALQMRNPSQGAGMPGALSDRDVQILQSMIPNINMTPDGIRLLTDTMRKLYQRSIDSARIANDFMRTPEAKQDPLKLHTKLQEFANANPLFEQKPAAAGQSERPPITDFGQNKLNEKIDKMHRPSINTFGGQR